MPVVKEIVRKKKDGEEIQVLAREVFYDNELDPQELKYYKESKVAFNLVFQTGIISLTPTNKICR